MASMQDKIRKLEFSKKYAWHQFFLMKNLVEELSRGIVDIPEHIKNQIIDLAKKANDSLECSICLETLCDKKRMTKITRCGHIFHVECLDQVDNNQCPNCRSKL
jgi:hypothetical protein